MFWLLLAVQEHLATSAVVAVVVVSSAKLFI
jgi:hypothetical protein